MKRTALVAAIVVVIAACSSPNSETTTILTGAIFPVTVEADNGSIVIDDYPEVVISLSSTATEMLFAIGAGPQVVAVDDQSNYPPEAPVTDLSGFTPNLEAILSYEPDLVVITFDPGDLIAGLEAAGVPVLSYTAALTIDDVYRQMEALGSATGNLEEAQDANQSIEVDLATIVDDAGTSGEGATYYHEIDALLYTATSSTFFGEIYQLFGMENIADPADEDGDAFGYPQLSEEYVVASDPNIIFLANVLYGESAETVSARPGWEAMSAVASGDIVELDSDVASRWGPRIVDFAQSIADGLKDYQAG